MFIARYMPSYVPSIGEEEPIEIFNSCRDLYLSALDVYKSRRDYDKLVSPRGGAIVDGQICCDTNARLEVHKRLVWE